jgi:uncharacterized protein (DUF2252 family)
MSESPFAFYRGSAAIMAEWKQAFRNIPRANIVER